MKQSTYFLILTQDLLLKTYQDQLSFWRLKDDRIRRLLPRRIVLTRMVLRLTWSLFLFSISIPGLLLWVPVFLTTAYCVHNFKKTGPIWDTWDEIAQYKLIYGVSICCGFLICSIYPGLVSGLCVWFGTTAATFPIAPITFMAVPLCMWMTLRWVLVGWIGETDLMS